jgi:hypothetical protein
LLTPPAAPRRYQSPHPSPTAVPNRRSQPPQAEFDRLFANSRDLEAHSAALVRALEALLPRGPIGTAAAQSVPRPPNDARVGAELLRSMLHVSVGRPPWPPAQRAGPGAGFDIAVVESEAAPIGFLLLRLLSTDVHSSRRFTPPTSSA